MDLFQIWMKRFAGNTDRNHMDLILKYLCGVFEFVNKNIVYMLIITQGIYVTPRLHQAKVVIDFIFVFNDNNGLAYKLFNMYLFTLIPTPK